MATARNTLDRIGSHPERSEGSGVTLDSSLPLRMTHTLAFMQVRAPQTDDEFARYYNLRWQVLRAPWGQPRGAERDELESSSDHALIIDDNDVALAVGRLHLNSPTEAQIRYMAVADAARGQGLGRRIVAYLETIARQRGASIVVLNAREAVAGFYQRLGYEIVGPGPTMFGTIAHVKMQKQL
jgi:GNAT superfamily N-acetyltransferase